MERNNRNIETDLDYLLKSFDFDKDYENAKRIRERITNEINNRNLDLLLDKLCYDDYISSKEIISENSSKLAPPTFYRITYHGRLFLKRGGYKNESRLIKKIKSGKQPK